MKKTNFLSKLKKEGKLELVDSSEEIKQSYIIKSESNITSSKIGFSSITSQNTINTLQLRMLLRPL